MSDNMAMSPEQLQAIDKQHIWHPYSQVAQDQSPALPIVDSAQGVYLKLASGEQVIDGMSSWWCMLHGYNHPVLNAAAKAQLDKMSHVMFGGLTHEPAVRLAKLLVDITPAGLDKVFFADSGSVSVEVAIKMALQYWHSLGRPEKQRLITIKNGYHGDTFGAMASCDPVNGMHHLFSANLPQHHFLEAPPMGFDKPPCSAYLQDIRDYIAKHHHEIAAFILEPVVQGAGGMRFYSPAYLQEIKVLCDEFDLLLIADEIATGFGRSGKLFACEHAGISPDILCLGKALSGGYMTLAATLCSEKIANGICNGEASVFMHGPTFMANPLACATALASTELLLQQDWASQITNIETQLSIGLAPLRNAPDVADVRVLGAIGVVEMKQDVDKEALQSALIERGVWLRPFGKLVYTMPPFVSTNEELQQLCSAMVETLSQ
ncbi:adenosylmethionine--8-amino-7-oxononanoate transaminase [uncultured Pseudoteredinibacter sp.]|uniref:adenosylmethionine--8-amino-7-oxononanoate transaminase n=1 Tax=uncultured Pseudoteredinibacter sp. TaxID=1641701 RepID=UPI0026368C6B|nr:adenosylmethionine--8-amino-7-oxononanoate transaminase [uncultured Pseudoteredinibacter sp.]